MNSDNESHSERERKLEEASIFNAFASIVSSKFSEQTNVDRLDRLYQHPDYSGEKALLTKMNNNGMVAGIVSGVGSFVFLRRYPRVLSKYLLRRAEASRGNGGGSGNGSSSSSAYRFDRQSPFDTASNQQQQLITPNDAHEPRRPGLILRTIKFGLDIAVSSVFAMYMSAIWTDKKKLLDEAAEIPLVEGRSLIADEMCEDFIKQYGSISQDSWEPHRHTSDALGAIEAFVANCQRRRIHEHALQKERGMRPGGMREGEHISIPSPGVPRDIDAVLEELGKNHDEQESSGNDNDANNNQFDEMADGDLNKDDNYEAIGEWTSVDDFKSQPETKKEKRWGW